MVEILEGQVKEAHEAHDELVAEQEINNDALDAAQSEACFIAA